MMSAVKQESLEPVQRASVLPQLSQTRFQCRQVVLEQLVSKLSAVTHWSLEPVQLTSAQQVLLAQHCQQHLHIVLQQLALQMSAVKQESLELVQQASAQVLLQLAQI